MGSRRSFIKAGIGTALAALTGGAAWQWQGALRKEFFGSHVDPRGKPPPSFAQSDASAAGFSFAAQWIQDENALPGTTQWAINQHAIPGHLDGYCSTVSAQQGDHVDLFVSCVDSTFHVEAYRMGYYAGRGARLIWTSAPIAGRKQPAGQFTPGINMVECHWVPSLTFVVASNWPEGTYLLKLVASGGQQRYVPLTIRNDASRATFVVQNSVTSWQAYNSWGGYSQYFGLPKSFANRSRVVSYDRPYDSQWAFGSADFMGNEFPFIMFAEKLGLDVTYWTDIDFSARPELLVNHSTLVSLGHDEYWSPSMYDAALLARQAGVNFLFLGANACFRRIRLESSPLGPNRRQVCYKIATEDPLYGKNNSAVTANFPSPPNAQPESSLIGNMYQSNGVDANMVIVDPSSWILSGTGLGRGALLHSVVGPEYDGYDPAIAGPRNLDIIAHSPVKAFGRPGYSDMTWYCGPGEGGVFSTGTNWWVHLLSDNSGLFNPGLVPGPVPRVTEALMKITENVLVACTGPAGDFYPSKGTWRKYYTAATGIAASNYRTFWPA